MATNGGPQKLYNALVEVIGGRNLPEKELIFEVMEKTRMMFEMKMYNSGMPTTAIAHFVGVSQNLVWQDLCRMQVPRRPPGRRTLYYKSDRAWNKEPRDLVLFTQGGYWNSRHSQTRQGDAPMP